MSAVTVPYVCEQLDIGDIHIVSPDGATRLIMERKTLADLAASVKDGRYKEQKTRMLAAVPAHHITYIIEGGNMNPSDGHGLSRSSFMGAFIHSMYRDGVHVVWTANVHQTAQWIADVAEKLAGMKITATAAAEPSYVQCLRAKTRRQDNLDPRTVYLLQLAQIPSVNVKIAEAIAAHYPTLCDLVQAVATAADPIALLTSIPLIGAKKAATIALHLKPSPHEGDT